MKFFALTALLAAFASPAAAICPMDMEAPSPGSSAGVGPLVTLPDGVVSLTPFNGTFFGGIATIVVSNYAGGSVVQEMNLNNINFRVQATPAVETATFEYADLGGTTNLMVNGVWLALADLSMAPAMMGGVNVTVTRFAIPGGHNGTVTLTANTSPINRFAVGGQEFFIDDVCW